MTEVLVDTESCDVCGARASFSPRLSVSMAGKFDADVCECARCGFRQVRPRLSLGEVGALYGTGYFDPEGTTGFSGYALQQQRYERVAYFLAKRLRRIAERGRLLEVGCALGFLLDGLRRWTSWEVEGLDIVPFAAAYARKVYDLKVECGTLEGAAYPDESFDFIIQKDVLEHVLNPRDHLVETARILRPGGHVWLVTPNGEANLRPMRRFADELRVRPDRMLPVMGQGHLSFFTRRNLLRLASDCGFECVRFRNISLKRGMRALGHLPRKRRRPEAAPAGRPRGLAVPIAPTTAAQAPEDEEKLIERVRADVDSCRKRVRSWRVYYYFRQILKLADALPARLTVGLDFDVILRKRPDGRSRA